MTTRLLVRPCRYHQYDAHQTQGPRAIETAIRSKLQAGLQPEYMEVINESYMHKVDEDAESHFKVVVVSHKFDNESLVKRHRLVNSLLQHELQHGLHAISVIAQTPDQWEKSNKQVRESPACRGGTGL